MRDLSGDKTVLNEKDATTLDMMQYTKLYVVLSNTKVPSNVREVLAWTKQKVQINWNLNASYEDIPNSHRKYCQILSLNQEAIQEKS